jgi:hypothetical protein
MALLLDEPGARGKFFFQLAQLCLACLRPTGELVEQSAADVKEHQADKELERTGIWQIEDPEVVADEYARQGADDHTHVRGQAIRPSLKY